MQGLPRIIHQTWKTATIPGWARSSTQSWQKVNPGWRHRVWVDSEVREFMKTHHPELSKESDWDLHYNFDHHGTRELSHWQHARQLGVWDCVLIQSTVSTMSSIACVFREILRQGAVSLREGSGNRPTRGLSTDFPRSRSAPSAGNRGRQNAARGGGGYVPLRRAVHARWRVRCWGQWDNYIGIGIDIV